MGPVASHQVDSSWQHASFSGPRAALSLWSSSPAWHVDCWVCLSAQAVWDHERVCFSPAAAAAGVVLLVRCVCRLTPYLASLSTSQLKLLTIYYNRAQGKQHAEGHM